MKYPDALIEHCAIYRIIKRRQNSPEKKISLKELEKKNKKSGIFAIGKREDMKVYREVVRRLESGT